MIDNHISQIRHYPADLPYENDDCNFVCRYCHENHVDSFDSACDDCEKDLIELYPSAGVNDAKHTATAGLRTGDAPRQRGNL